MKAILTVKPKQRKDFNAWSTHVYKEVLKSKGLKPKR